MKSKGMTIGRAGLLALVLAFAAQAPGEAQAQQTVTTVPAARVATPTASGTISVTDTFQQLWADQPTRVNCLVQNNGSATLWVFAGASAAASKARSVVLAPGQSWNCAQSGTVVTSAVQVTGTAGGAFTALLDGSGTISGAPSSVTVTGTPNVDVTRIGGHVLVQGGVNGLLGVGGNVASGTADSGNPVKTGCVFNTVQPTVTNGQRIDCQATATGNIKVVAGTGGNFTASDGYTNAGILAFSDTYRPLATANAYFNGTTWDRARGDTNGAFAQGNVASGAADAGNPVKIGGVVTAGGAAAQLPSLVAGTRSNLPVSQRGEIPVNVSFNGFSASIVNANSDGNASTSALAGTTFPLLYNGSTWDRWRGDTSGAYVRSNFAFSTATTITRPANVTAYSAGDVVGGAITFANMGTSGGRIMLTSSQLEIDIAAIPAGMSNFYLALYNVTPPSALADNAPFDIPSGDRASFLGIVQLGTPVDYGSTLYVEQNVVNKQIKLAGTNLFGYLVTVAGYTPAANSEVYVPTLHSVGVGL